MALCTGSLLVNLFGILTAIVAIFYAYMKWIFQHWRKRNVPYLEPKVPFGNLMNPYTKTINEGIQVRALHLKAKAKGWKYCGMYNVFEPSLLVLDLDLLKNVLTKDFSHFTDRGLYTNEKDDPLSAHLFAIGGTKWKNLRAKLSPTFTSGKMKMMFQTLLDTGLILENFLKENITSRDAVDIKDILGRFSTDVIGSCAFGIDCNSFKDPDSPFRVYGKRVFVQTNLESLKQAFCQSFPNLGRSLGLTVFPKDVIGFFTKTVKNVVAYRERNNVTRNDFMQLVIDMRNNKVQVQDGSDGLDDNGRALTMDEITAQSFVFFAAGFETSSTTMTFALFELATHPELQDKVRNEIKTVLGKHNNQMTYDSLSELKYMSQVIDETLRKYPPVPFITRSCVEDYKIPGEDYVIEKGTMMIISIEGIHYDEEYYKNPNVFDPDRFTEENKRTRHPYAHIPFGEGPRICIGKRFGILQTKIGLTTVLRNFNVKLHKNTKIPLKMSTRSFIPSIEGHLWLSFDKI